MNIPAHLSEPVVQRLPVLLEEFAEGLVQIPRFQRTIVWTDEQRLELLRSVRDGTPIGSILVWRTTRTDIQVMENLGPHRFSAKPRLEGACSYLLDGHQRMSTLYGALASREANSLQVEAGRPEAWRWDFAYHLMEDDFVLLNGNRAGQYLLPLWFLLDSRSLIRFQRQLDDEGQIEKLDKLQRRFRDYRIAVLPIVGDDIGIATMAFQRLNSRGTPMSQFHMIVALTWSPKFDLRARVEALKESVLRLVGWEDFEQEAIIDVCKEAIGSLGGNVNVDGIAAGLRENPQILTGAGEAIARAARFLRHYCAVGSPKMVPHPAIAVLLAEGFRRLPDPPSDILELLRLWFWWASYAKFLAGARVFDFDEARSLLLDVVAGQANVYKFLPLSRHDLPQLSPVFDFSLPRTKLLALLVAGQSLTHKSKQAQTWIVDRLAEKGSGAFSSIWPLDQTSGNSVLFMSIANKILAKSSEAQEVRELIEGGRLIPDFLSYQYVISERAIRRFSKEGIQSFLEQRLLDLRDLEWAFLEKEGLIQIPEDPVAEEPLNGEESGHEEEPDFDEPFWWSEDQYQ